MKYICTKDEDGNEQVFTFPRAIDHDAMAEVLEHIKNQTHGNWERVYRRPVSAGFVNSKGECHGRSETLGVKSRGDVDTIIMQDYAL